MLDEQDRIDWFDDRFYKVGEEFFPSVTTVLGIINKPFLLQWYGDIGTETARYRSKLAKEKGSLIHDGIYKLLTEGFVSGESYKQEDYYQIWNFLQFYEAFNPKVIANEVIVFDKGIKSAGTLDLLINIPDGTYDTGYAKKEKLLGGNYLIDVKTGNMSLDYHYQTAAYARMAITQELVPDIQGTGILQTKSDTKKGWKLTLRDRLEVDNDYECFLSALKLFNAKGGEKPKVFDMPATLEIESILKQKLKKN